ncbi:hypothetical protein [Burkholderia ubonensis]|uniref:hypothetical protein n=1 Tax=Burkholderia ubonensis TaxID=101571 RepID=UPI001E531AA0|nr:hypothetical protein [Burkholderia ubonensis]
MIDETKRVIAEKRLPNDRAEILALLAPWHVELANQRERDEQLGGGDRSAPRRNGWFRDVRDIGVIHIRFAGKGCRWKKRARLPVNGCVRRHR